MSLLPQKKPPPGTHSFLLFSLGSPSPPCHRLANFYFLFITILQLLPVSSTRPTTWLPLSIAPATAYLLLPGL